MKAGVLFGDKEIRVGDTDEPQVADGEVLIRSQYAGICGTDLHIYRGEFTGRVTYPAVLGHEFGGIVAEVGKGVTRFKADDRVVVDPIISCFACEACLTGHINACRTLKVRGVDLDGGYGEYVSIPESYVYKLPDSVPMIYGPMVEMYGLGHHVLQRGRVQPGETVVILGTGKLGLSILDVLCHSANPSQVFVADRLPFRLETAVKLGADVAVNVETRNPVELVLEQTEGVGVDCVIEAVGHYHEIEGQEPPVGQAVRMVKNGGRVVTTGLTEQLTPVHFKSLVLKEAEIIASRVTLGEFPRAIRMMDQGLLHPELLVTHEMPMREVDQAFALVDREDPDTIKVVLEVQGF